MAWSPNVGKREFRDLKNHLHYKGFSDNDIHDVEKVFRGDLETSDKYDRGIDKEELKSGVKWLKENKRKHSLSDEQIETLEKSFEEEM